MGTRNISLYKEVHVDKTYTGSDIFTNLKMWVPGLASLNFYESWSEFMSPLGDSQKSRYMVTENCCTGFKYVMSTQIQW